VEEAPRRQPRSHTPDAFKLNTDRETKSKKILYACERKETYGGLRLLGAPVVLSGSNPERLLHQSPAEWQQHDDRDTVYNMFSPYPQSKLDPFYWRGRGGPGSEFATNLRPWAWYKLERRFSSGRIGEDSTAICNLAFASYIEIAPAGLQFTVCSLLVLVIPQLGGSLCIPIHFLLELCLGSFFIPYYSLISHPSPI
jgi:hypothetical protein